MTSRFSPFLLLLTFTLLLFIALPIQAQSALQDQSEGETGDEADSEDSPEGTDTTPSEDEDKPKAAGTDTSPEPPTAEPTSEAEAADPPPVEGTEAAEEGADAVEEGATEEEEKKVEVSLIAEAGGIAIVGNTRSFSAHGLVSFGVKADKNKFSTAIGANWGRSYITENKEWVTTATRFFGNLRYDRFITERNSIFVTVGAFNDKFAGYRLRLEANLGYSHLLVKTDRHNLTGEAGANYTFDWYATTPEGVEPDPIRQHFVGARLFLGYALKLSDNAGFSAGVESLLGGTDNMDARFDGRLNANLGLNAAITKAIALKLGFQLAYDFVPPEGFKPLDTITSLSIVATLM